MNMSNAGVFGGDAVIADLNTVFNGLIDHRFPFAGYGDRRASFIEFVRSFSNAYTGIRVFLSRWSEFDHEHIIFSCLQLFIDVKSLSRRIFA